MNVNQTKFVLSNEVAEKILCVIDEGLLICNAQDNIQMINGAALRIFGFAKEEDILGRPIHSVFKSSEAAFDFLTHLEKKKQIDQEEIILSKRGEDIRCSFSASIIRDSTFPATEFKVIVLRDITVRAKTEQKLQEYAARLEKSNKELDQFAYIVSHDLKAPLRAIINLSQWLQEDLDATLSEESKKNLDMLKSRTFRMEALISGILEYSKIGRSKIQSELIDVEDLVSDVLDSLLPPKHIKIETSKLPFITAPKIMLFQVFSNLIGNAIKYNDKVHGMIKIQAVELKDSHEFSIEDNGPGIAKEFHEKVFIIFQTLQSRDRLESTGIGLTIVKRILEEQGGKIWIESEVGKGSKFIFQWPKSQANNIIL